VQVESYSLHSDPVHTSESVNLELFKMAVESKTSFKFHISKMLAAFQQTLTLT
jgi:hypothetical protein